MFRLCYIGVVVAAVALLVVTQSVSAPALSTAATPNPLEAPAAADFGEYWFAGKAEVSRYELQQSRYGEIHPGDAVMIFVTEDFLPKRQVKSDDTNRTRSGSVPILKLNATKKFNTGVYPYSLMTSTFSPLDTAAHPHALKSTTTVQEWCGHVFTQFNRRGDNYQVRGFSYFQSEGDQDVELPVTWLEDEVWTRLRLDPSTLPTGTVTMIPGSQYLRLAHREVKAVSAVASLETNDGQLTYRIRYPSLNRELSIRLDAAFPHRIQGWEEVGGAGGTLTTRATRTHTEMLDYWNHHDRADTPLRAKLGL